MGSSPPSTQTTKTEPWEGMKTVLQDRIFPRAETLGNQPLEFFGGQTFAPQSPYTTQAIHGTASRAIAGAPVERASQGYAQGMLENPYASPLGQYAGGAGAAQGADTLGQFAAGGFMGDPTLGHVQDAVMAKVLPQVDNAYLDAYRTGGAGRGQELVSRFTEAYAPIAHAAHQQGLQRQYGAADALYGAGADAAGNLATAQNQLASLGPTLGALDYQNLGQLAQAGAAQEDFAQMGINEAMARHDFGQNEPWTRLGQEAQIIYGAPGGTTAFTSGRPGGGGLGGAISGGLGGAGVGLMAASALGGPAAPFLLGGAALGALGGLWR